MSNTMTDNMTAVFQKYALEVDQFLSHKVGRDAAQDLSQEVYLRFSRINQPENIKDLKAYLFRIAQNMVIDYWRKQHRQSETDLSEATLELQPSPTPEPERVIASQQQYAQLQQAIKKMPSQCRIVFLMHKVDGLSYNQVAESLNISHKTVEKHISKALKACRKELEKE